MTLSDYHLARLLLSRIAQYSRMLALLVAGFEMVVLSSWVFVRAHLDFVRPRFTSMRSPAPVTTTPDFTNPRFHREVQGSVAFQTVCVS
jgi:hypothetical protein